MKASFKKHTFIFKQPSGTSRGVLTEKHAWFIEVFDEENPTIIGVGECSIIPGLSPDFQDFDSYEFKIDEVCKNINHFAKNFEDLIEFPSILFGLETALLDLKNGGKKIIFDNKFSKGQKRIPINGLIWMGSVSFMQEQIHQKLDEGYSCIKMKIGAIDFDQELEILKTIRERFSKDKITLRVDANGAFSVEEALEKLKKLSDFDIHSVEQPIRQGNWTGMKTLCVQTPIPIALDEELIGINDRDEKINLLQTIRPHFIILKPSLHGGIIGTSEWIELAENENIPWWITSALESNIGLNAIAQFTGEFENNLPQGLGTGSLYTNNIPSNLKIENGELFNLSKQRN